MSVSVQSSGQGGFSSDVIIAMTEWPAGVLNAAASESTKAGRFFVAVRSENGKGTRTTVCRSKLTVGLVVGGACPLAQRAFDGAQVLDVHRLDAAHGAVPSVGRRPRR